MRFRDRANAGVQLGAALERYRSRQPLVAGLARGGVLVAAEVARALDAPLHLTVVRKLGHPAHPELGLGALAEDGVPVWNDLVLGQLAIDEQQRYRVLAQEREEMRRRRQKYRRGLLPPELNGRTVVLVDDGLATGGTARAAIGFAYRRGAEYVVLAVPVGAPDTVAMLREEADDVVALVTPAELAAVGQWYQHFEQCTDKTVLDVLRGHY